MRSVGNQPPWFGPGLPVYPWLAQVIRAQGSPQSGNVYEAFVQQWNSGLTLRDREQCWLWEPNGIFLQPGYYDARLIGSYQDLPLFATWCCQAGGSSSLVG